ncbi:FAD-dependent oxidoreductase [uncultured Victivallis sp.]|uniref:FAD-dependent oxidoreductase n=1 Tax=uncultured Victivallis sp. TaxID=354118 RepID=UPI0025D181F6|nr:FAD-dependent oxidoreductase [uncultured Victivallis sp.]
MAEIFLEAEEFEEPGGWVVDPQSYAQVGSAYLMAHGMGVPVADARTRCRIPESGLWHIWARTRNWVAVWKPDKAAGLFRVAVNGMELPATLGDGSPDWSWRKAGSLRLDAGEIELSLHDLNGFNGRCDALYLTTAETVPPDEPEELAVFRRRLCGTVVADAPEEYDLIVVGGGIAGICCAIAAARTDSRVLLIQDRPVPGGCNSSEIRVGMGGFARLEPYPEIGWIVSQIEPVAGSGATYPAEWYEDARKTIAISHLSWNKCRLLLNTRVVGLEMDPEHPKRIAAVIARDLRSGTETRYRAPLFADCTGDAELARRAGCEVMYGREAKSRFHESLAPEQADRLVMGHSVLWYSEKRKEEAPFPELDWALDFDESKVLYVRGGDWEQETGFRRDQIEEIERIRDYGLLAIYSNWSYLKNRSKRSAEWSREALAWVSSCGGKRESCRVIGDLVLTQNDIENHVPYPDATAAMSWNLDLHLPEPANEEQFPEPFRSCAYHRGIEAPYPVPYRCLYARDAENLFLGGRHISVSHVAFSCVRVMRTLGALGEVIGLAATLCRETGSLPRGIYEHHFSELQEKMRRGLQPWPYHAYRCDDVEQYHFKEIGFVQVWPRDDRPTADPAAVEKIRRLGIPHRHE